MTTTHDSEQCEAVIEQFPEEVMPEGTPDSVPTKTPDAELRLTDEGLEMPEFLKGYTGTFTMRTPSITGEFETIVPQTVPSLTTTER